MTKFAEDRKLNFVNLCSRGYTVRAARKQSGYYDDMPNKQEVKEVKDDQTETASPVLTVEEEKAEIRKALKEFGINPAPNAKLETLQKKLAEAQADVL